MPVPPSPTRRRRERIVVVAFSGLLGITLLSGMSDFVPQMMLIPSRPSDCTVYEVFDTDGMALPPEMFGLGLPNSCQPGSTTVLDTGRASKVAGYGKKISREQVIAHVRTNFPDDSDLDQVLVVQRVYGPKDIRRVGLSAAQGIIVRNPVKE